MAVTVTDDVTTLDAADSATGWAVDGVHSQPIVDPDSNVEGTGCIECRIQNGGGLGTILNNHGSTNFLSTNDGKHLYMWMRQSMIWATVASNGVRFRIGTGELSNYGEWNVLGQDKGIASYKAWVNGCVDPVHPFVATNGTPPALTAVVWSGANINWATGNGKSLAVIDEVKLGSWTFVKGGGVSTQGTFAEVASNDETNGRGFVKAIGGVYFVNAGIEWGDTGTATTYFADSLQTVIFEDFSVSGALYTLSVVGNATGTNSVVFGSSSGTGVNKEGSGGIIFRAAGEVPFRLHAMNANIDAAHFFGCSFIGPAALYACPMRNFKFEDNSASSFTDDTRDANDAGANDAPLMPSTQALNDAAYFGHDAHTYGLNITVGTAKTGTWTVEWEYWNGSAWVHLHNVTDGTNAFGTTGAQTVTWTMPVDWAKNTVDGNSRYWVRARINSFTSSGTQPLLTVAKMTLSGDVHAHTSNFEAIGCNFVNMGSIHVKNGAFLKKCVITDSTVPSTNAAVDLEDADPTANTVRDLTIQNCTKGILLRDHERFLDAGAAVNKGGGLVGIPSTGHGFAAGKSITIAGTTNYNGTYTLDVTTSANELVIPATFVSETFATTDTANPNTTYNFRNIQFANNTNDVRVDYPANSTVTINILENGDTPSVDNVNTSTVQVNNAVNVTIAGVTEGTPVKVLAAETVGTRTKGEVLSEQLADANGEITFAINYEAAFNPSGLDVTVRARNQGVATACIAEDGGVFTDQTLAGVSNTTADMTLLPATPAVGDAYYFGHTEQYQRLMLNVTTALAGTGNTIAWEYWNGSAWASLPTLSDATNGLETAGENVVAWSTPTGWATTTVNSQGPFYYVRARLSASTTVTTTPVGGRVALDTTRYLPYNATRTITTTGLADNATWAKDTVSQLSPDPLPVAPPFSAQVVSAVNGTSNAASGTTLSATVTLPVGTNRKLIVWATSAGSTTNQSFTYDGNACTVARLDANVALGRITQAWYNIPDVDSGSKTVQVTFGTADTNRNLWFCVVTDTSTAAEETDSGEATGAGGTAATTTLTNTNADAVIIQGALIGSSALNITAGTNDTLARNVTGAGGEQTLVYEVVNTAASQTTEVTWTTASTELRSGAIYAHD